MKEISFLFGAGADVHFGIPVGLEFTMNTMIESDFYDANMGKVLRNHYGEDYNYNKICSRKIVKNKLISRLFYQYLVNEFDSFQNINKLELFYGLLLKEDIDDLPLEKKLSDKQRNILINLSDSKLRLNKYAELLEIMKSDSNNDLEGFPGISKYYDSAIRGIGQLEEYFYTIIDPEKYGILKFMKIYNYYWKSYFYIVRYILNYQRIDSPDIKDLNSNIESEEYYSYIVENVSDFTQLLWSWDYDVAGSYYSEIYNSFKNSEINFFTTNYTPFIYKVNENSVYLHGNIKFFENYKNLDVYDISKKQTENIRDIFPFILGTSPIKPIIHPIETECFYKFSKKLKRSDALVIVGYGINEDDNHINAIIRDAVTKSNTKIIYCNYCGNNENELNEDRLLKKLRLESKDKIKCLNYKNNEDLLEGLNFLKKD